MVVNGAGWYVVQAGDSLWSIAEVHYGYGGAYRRIHRFNWDSTSDPNLIFPCQRIFIPRRRSDWPSHWW